MQTKSSYYLFEIIKLLIKNLFMHLYVNNAFKPIISYYTTKL